MSGDEFELVTGEELSGLAIIAGKYNEQISLAETYFMLAAKLTVLPEE